MFSENSLRSHSSLGTVITSSSHSGRGSAQTRSQKRDFLGISQKRSIARMSSRVSRPGPMPPCTQKQLPLEVLRITAAMGSASNKRWNSS